jgi:hypothetical protein
MECVILAAEAHRSEAVGAEYEPDRGYLYDNEGIDLLRWLLVGLALVAVVILAAHFAARWLQS